MDLVAAQKVDSAVVKVIGRASQVAIYHFSEASKNWEKSQHTGTLLICQRNQAPDYSFIILNTEQPQNYEQVMDPGTSLQRKGEYLLYKPPTAEAVRAIWFYNEADCVQIFDLVKGVLDKAKEALSKKVQQPLVAEVAGRKSSAKMGKDILSMLSSAKTAHNAPISAQGQMAAQAGGTVNVTEAQRASAVGAGGDGRQVQTAISSSIQVENLLKNFNIGTGSNGPSAVGKGNQPTGAAIDGQGGKEQQSNSAFVGGLGKGRGRPPTTNEYAPALQRLFVAPGGSEKQQPPLPQQQAVSAFTNIASRQRTVPVTESNNIPPLPPVTTNSGSITSPLMSPGGGLSELQDYDLVTPADLAADDGFGTAAMARAAAVPFSAASVLDQTPVIQTSSVKADTLLPMGQAGITLEQFRQQFVYLLEHNQDFVKHIYDEFVKVSTQGQRGNTGSVAWRKN